MVSSPAPFFKIWTWYDIIHVVNGIQQRNISHQKISSNLLKDADDVLHRMLEDIGSSSKNLHGHGGPVYGLSFSPGELPVVMVSQSLT